MLRILVEYARRGARVVRLDAIAFLWKRLGTSCLHLMETHELVKLMRDVLAAYSPPTLVLTETNVPHAENVSYFGDGDEAHMVYQFSLPPLLLDAFLSGDATAICSWLSDLQPPPPGCTFFNFTASHDGVGVRPLEGLVSDERLGKLVEAVRERGALVNTRRQADGSDAPYELNIAWVDALKPNQANPTLHVKRVLSSQAVMLALQGMPAVYFHTLVGTPNDHAGVTESGINRRINRHKYEYQELNALLHEAGSLQREIFDGMQNLLAKRRAEKAFHPEAKQRVIEAGVESMLAFERVSSDEQQRIFVATNFAEEEQNLRRPKSYQGKLLDLITDETIESGESLQIEPGSTVWLTLV